MVAKAPQQLLRLHFSVLPGLDLQTERQPQKASFGGFPGCVAVTGSR